MSSTTFGLSNPQADALVMPLRWRGDPTDERGWVRWPGKGTQGSGGSSMLFLGKWTDRMEGSSASKRKLVAMKVLHMFFGNSAEASRIFKKEIFVWCQLEHKHLLPLYGTCEQSTGSDIRMFMVSPFVQNGDAIQYLKKHPAVDIAKLLVQTASALAYLHMETKHKPAIVHGDVRGENILISEMGNVLLTDFGLSGFERNGSRHDGTARFGVPAFMAPFMAPELLLGESPHSRASDVFAFGILIHQLYHGHSPFQDLSTEAIIVNSLRGKRPARPAKCINDDIWRVAKHCWANNSLNRPQMKDVYWNLVKFADSSICMSRNAVPLDPSDIVIAVLGNVGVGKSTFINVATRRPIAAPTSHTLQPRTQEVGAISSYHHDNSGRRIVFVDVPGLANTDTNIDGSESNVLEAISRWLEASCPHKIYLSGILYLHKFADIRTDNKALRNVRLFRNLCGTVAMENVVLVTSMRSAQEDVEAKWQKWERHNQFWRTMTKFGARPAPFDGTFDCAWKIIDIIANRARPRRIVHTRPETMEEDYGAAIPVAPSRDKSVPNRSSGKSNTPRPRRELSGLPISNILIVPGAEEVKDPHIPIVPEVEEVKGPHQSVAWLQRSRSHLRRITSHSKRSKNLS